ncbi:MAG TPA: DUF167 domain-containing protein [Gemmatimonadales bacterium]|jgi:uncharacterized protein (TIGR00251 family)
MPPVDPMPGGVRLTIHAQPRAALNKVVGLHGDAVKVRLTATPVEGAANRALVQLLATVLGVAPARVRLTAGGTARRKTVEIAGLTPKEALERLGLGD